MSNEVIRHPDNTLAPEVEFTGKRIYAKFKEGCLKQDKVLEDCLFGAVKITKNADIDKYKYCRYGIGFDSKGTFSHPSGSSFGQNVIMFGAEMSSSIYANNRANNILVFGRSFTTNGTTIYAEKMYSPNFTVTKKNSV